MQKALHKQIQAIEKGLPFKEFNSVRQRLSMTQQSLGQAIGIGHTTLSKRKKDKRFTMGESERIHRISRLLERATDVFEDKNTAKDWMNTPLEYLQGQTPLQFTSTELGGREVENLLGRIERGVPS
ncbi:MAG: antitoxin Xre/MbcA/ParS toxin-binding domain-containing protein [Desulfobacteraceae bacterium]